MLWKMLLGKIALILFSYLMLNIFEGRKNYLLTYRIIHMNRDNRQDQAKEAAHTLKDSAKKTLDNPKQEIIAGSKDWMNYIQTHPIQTLIFSVVGYFALKGLFK